MDGRTIETLARASDVIDAEPVDEAQRVEMRQADKRDGDGKTRPPARLDSQLAPVIPTSPGEAEQRSEPALEP